MVNKKMSASDMLKKDHYRSIYNLTIEFGNKKGRALSSKHYRYALVKDDPIKYKASSVKDFFLDEDGNNLLEKHYDNGSIIKDCIRGRNLKEFLRKMESRGLIEPVSFTRNRKYIAGHLIYADSFIQDYVEIIKDYPRYYVVPYPQMGLDDSIAYQKGEYLVSTLFGFPNHMFSRLTKDAMNMGQYKSGLLLTVEDTEEIQKNLISIYESLLEIGRIKKKYCPLHSFGFSCWLTHGHPDAEKKRKEVNEYISSWDGVF